MEKTMSKTKKIGETLALYNCSKCGKEFYFFQGMDESLVICDSCRTIQDQPEEVNNSQDKVQFKSEQDQPDKKDKKEKEVKKIIIKTGKGWDCESGVSYEDYLAGEVCKYFEGIEDRAREEFLGKLSKELVVGIKEIQEKEEQWRDEENVHIEIDDLIVEKIGGELLELYNKSSRWGWYS